MNGEQIIERLKKEKISGEFRIEGNAIEWYEDIGFFNPETEESHDILHDQYCDFFDNLYRIFCPDNVEVVE